jgi:PAS domain S-box-containing protein
MRYAWLLLPLLVAAPALASAATGGTWDTLPIAAAAALGGGALGAAAALGLSLHRRRGPQPGLAEALRQAQQGLDAIQRAASIGAWRMNLGSGRIEWSAQAYRIFGLPEGEPITLERMFALVNPQDRAGLVERHRALADSAADLDFVHRIERTGGEERVVHARATVAARDAVGRPVELVGTVQDVTEAWEASGLSDALARALALSGDPVLLTREHAGVWLWAWSNRAWDRLCEQLRLGGREADHQLFNPVNGLLRAHAERVHEAQAQHKLLRLELALETTQGPRWFEAELTPQVGAPGRTGHGLLLLRDRSAERQAAQALRALNARLERTVRERTEALARSEQQYRVLADLSPQILWQADAHGQVVYLNRAWHELVGPREDGWLGMGWLDALHPDDAVSSMAAVADGMRARRPWQVRRRVRDRGGAYRSFLGVAAPVVGADGQVASWVGVDTDITELEQHARRLEQLNEELESFSYTVSHDLRAPLHVIRGFVDALLAGQVGRIDEQARDFLGRVLRSARRMEELIADLLALARLSRETLRRQRFDPGELARGLLSSIRERYPDRAIECRTDGDAVPIEADRRLFQVLLENLLDNAVKFSAGRPVCRIEIDCRREGEEVVLEVADNGVGFPQESAHRLFRPYQRLHAQGVFPGNGIGLATVARIVGLHGGSISAHNRETGGALFRLRLPTSLPVAAPAPTTETP